MINSFTAAMGPCGIYLIKVNNGSTRIMFKICSKLKINTAEIRHRRRSFAFIINLAGGSTVEVNVIRGSIVYNNRCH